MSEPMSLEKIEEWLMREIDKLRHATSYSDRKAAAIVNAQSLFLSKLVDVRLARVEEANEAREE
jgi:hypothetical protein